MSISVKSYQCPKLRLNWMGEHCPESQSAGWALGLWGQLVAGAAGVGLGFESFCQEQVAFLLRTAKSSFVKCEGY